MTSGGIEKPSLGFFNPIQVDEVEYVLVKLFINHLREMLRGNSQFRCEALQGKTSVRVELFVFHRASQLL